MRAKRRLIGIAVCSVLAVTATACSGSGSSGSSDSASPTASKASAKATKPAATPTAAPTTSAPAVAGPSIVLSFCDSTNRATRKIQLIDPETGEVRETRSFTVEEMTYHSLASCNTNLAGAQIRSAFDKNYDNMAVQKTADDKSLRVGMVPKDGSSVQEGEVNFQDLSGLSDGDGFGPPASQSIGAFGPNGDLYFVQKTGDHDGVLMSVGVNGGAPTAVAGGGKSSIDPADESDVLYFLKNGTKPDYGDSPGISTVYSSGGSYVISAGDGTISYGPNNGTTGKTTEPEYGKTLWPFGYVNKTTFFGSGDNQLYRATISGSKVKTEKLLPEADGDVKEPTLSPDGKFIVFVLEKADSRALWTVSTTPGSTPKPLSTPMDRTAQGTGILDWATVQ
jgi:hypothetical protein